MKKNKFLALTMLWSTLLSTSNISGIKNLDNKKSSTKQKVKNEDQQLEVLLQDGKKCLFMM